MYISGGGLINVGSVSVDGLINLMDCETWWYGMRIAHKMGTMVIL